MSNETAGRGEYRNERVLERSPSMVLRELGSRETICSTDALVAAYNEAADVEEREALRSWLQHYAEWFEEQTNKHLEEGMAEEYALLAGIVRPCDRDSKLLRRVFASLGERAHQKRYREQEVVRAVACFLQTVDEKVFDGVSSQRTELRNSLTDR